MFILDAINRKQLQVLAIIFIIVGLSGCASSPNSQNNSVSADAQQISTQLGKFISVLELIEQNRESAGRTTSASVKMKSMVGEVQQELLAIDEDATVGELIDKLSATAQRIDAPDLSMLTSILKLLSED